MDELKVKMVNLLVEQAETLAEMNASKKLEPEQIRKNAITILSIYQELTDHYNKAIMYPDCTPVPQNNCTTFQTFPQ